MTWSKDQSLRIWKIEPGLQEIVGFDDDEEEEEEEEEDEDESEEGTNKGSEEGRYPRSETEKTRSATADIRSEYDIIEVEEAKSLEEKEKRERERLEREEQEGKEEKKTITKEGIPGKRVLGVDAPPLYNLHTGCFTATDMKKIDIF